MDGSRWRPLKQPCPNDTLLIDVLFLHETGTDAAWFIDLVPVCLMGHTAVQTSVAQTLGSVLRISSLIHHANVHHEFNATRIGPCFARGQFDKGHHRSCSVVQASCEAHSLIC